MKRTFLYIFLSLLIILSVSCSENTSPGKAIYTDPLLKTLNFYELENHEYLYKRISDYLDTINPAPPKDYPAIPGQKHEIHPMIHCAKEVGENNILLLVSPYDNADDLILFELEKSDNNIQVRNILHSNNTNEPYSHKLSYMGADSVEYTLYVNIKYHSEKELFCVHTKSALKTAN